MLARLPSLAIQRSYCANAAYLRTSTKTAATTILARNVFPIATSSVQSPDQKSRAFSHSARSHSDNISMADAFREMEANGVPKKGEPTAAAAPEQEEQKELPKLSAAEFRVYNRMAEHMDLFVRSPLPCLASDPPKLIPPPRSTTTFARPGTCSTPPARPARSRRA